MLIANARIKYLINLSRVLYLPINNNKKEKVIIITVQISTDNKFPNMEFAIPAVTIVTAVCMVNMVHSVIKKKIGNKLELNL